MMANPVHIAMYSDVHCPYAYLTAFRLRKLRNEYRGHIVIEHKSLSLEYVNNRSTPKFIVDNEAPILMLEEPDIPYEPWYRSLTEWPVTMWPAFEAVKCAERQSFDLADDLDWAIRMAFFADSRCISMRFVLFELAEKVGLDMSRFADDFDGGVAKRLVLYEAQEGWEKLKVEGSPTLVLPSGKQLSYLDLGLPDVHLDQKRHGRVIGVEHARCSGQGCLDLLRKILDEALAEG